MYLQRYLPHFPAAGEVVIFDRSWYNRAGVERVMGFCKPQLTDRFLEMAPAFEKPMVDSGARGPVVSRVGTAAPAHPDAVLSEERHGRLSGRAAWMVPLRPDTWEAGGIHKSARYRPPLSKQVLERWVPAEGTGLPRRDDVQAEWRLGVPAVELDRAGEQVRLADGERVGFDRLLIATGVRARPWPNPAEAALKGVCVLRTREDADRLQRLLVAGPGRVLVIGSGFTGSEVASVCRELGLAVTVAEAGPAPLVSALGGVIGAVAADIQRENCVDLRCGVRVSALEGDADGRLCRARLSDGSTIDVDIAVAALGGIRNVEWLAGSGPPRPSRRCASTSPSSSRPAAGRLATTCSPRWPPMTAPRGG